MGSRTAAVRTHKRAEALLNQYGGDKTRHSKNWVSEGA